jgi:hypothetical protein
MSPPRRHWLFQSSVFLFLPFYSLISQAVLVGDLYAEEPSNDLGEITCFLLWEESDDHARLRPLQTGLNVSTPATLALSDFGLSLPPLLSSNISSFHVNLLLPADDH